MNEPWLDQAIRVLQAPTPTNAALTERILARVSVESAGARSRQSWLVGGLAAAAAVLLAVGVIGSRTPGGSAPAAPAGVTFRIEAPAASKVAVVGDFNGWDRTGIPLIRDRRTGIWQATVALPHGLYRYSYLVDGTRWAAEPDRTGPGDPDYGQPTSMMTVQ